VASVLLWGGGGIEKNFNVILVTFFCDFIVMTVRHNYSFKVRFRHNQLEKPQFGLITKLQVTNIEDSETLGTESPKRLTIFENLLLK